MQCEGGDTIEGANWMNLNGSAGQVMLPLLRIVSSADQLHRSDLHRTFIYHCLEWYERRYLLIF